MVKIYGVIGNIVGFGFVVLGLSFSGFIDEKVLIYRVGVFCVLRFNGMRSLFWLFIGIVGKF